ncbi:MAG: DEAD/DEAH box helicase, partial [Candidatus Omnitrophota bacterium]
MVMQEKKDNLEMPVRYLKGVGPGKSAILEKLGVRTISDLFYYLPRRYEDRTGTLDIRKIEPGQVGAVTGTVLKTNIFTAKTGTRIFEIAVGDTGGRIFAVWYNMPFISKVFRAGQKVVLYGKAEVQKRLQMIHPVYEILEDTVTEKSLDMGRIVPVYPLTANISQRYIRKLVDKALQSYLSGIRESLPTNLRARQKLVDLKFSIENIHFPYSFDNLDRAYKRLVFEEFFFLQIVMALRRKNVKHKGIQHETREGLISEFEGLFEFILTPGQKKCIKEIETDMAGLKPMNRLLQGDVGSGKTVVAMYALLLAVRNGYQAVMMAPTEILARQHYVSISKIFMPLGYNVRLLVRGIDPDDKNRVSNELVEGEADIVVGTHSLIQQGVNFHNLGLVIIDEQHKFGVLQREMLRKKGDMPDTLVLTATPIPRSLALTVFGDMDISLLKEKP